MFINKYKLDIRESIFLLKKCIVELTHSASRLEDVKTTFSQTKTIVDGMSVSGVSTDNMQVIINLKNAYHYVPKLPYNCNFYLAIACKINSYIAYNGSFEWGVLRTGDVGIHGVNYKPTIPIESEVVSTINKIWSSKGSKTFKKLKYMYYAMRIQLFWDGKLTAL